MSGGKKSDPKPDNIKSTGVSIEVFAEHNLDLPPGVRFVSGVIRATKPGP